MLNRESTLSLADIARDSGVKRRTIQLWTDAGVLRPLPNTMLRGSGVHRRFAKIELKLARALRSFHDQAIAIGMIKRIAESIRQEMVSVGQEKAYLIVIWDDIGPRAILADAPMKMPPILFRSVNSATIVCFG